MAQLPPSDEELGLFADQHDPDFYLDGEKLPPSSDNVLKALGREVIVPVTPFHPDAQVHGVAGGSGASQLSHASAIATGVPPGHQVPLHLGPGQLQVQDFAGGSVNTQLSSASAIAPAVLPGHQVPLHLGPGQVQVQGFAGGSVNTQLSSASAIAPAVLPGHQVPLHLGPGQLQLHGVAAGSATRQLSRASAIAPAVLPGHQLHLRPGHLRGVAVRSGPIRSPAPVNAPLVRSPPVVQQPDQMLRTVHLSPIPLGFHDTLQLKLQMEQMFGVNSIQELKLPIQHKGYGFATFYVKETCDAAINKRTINLNLGQGTEADAISLKPARRQ